jgi:hypothetical protein
LNARGARGRRADVVPRVAPRNECVASREAREHSTRARVRARRRGRARREVDRRARERASARRSFGR